MRIPIHRIAPQSRPRTPARLSVVLLLLLLLGYGAAPAAAFLPGALDAEARARLVRAGAAGVATERAYRLRLDPLGAPVPWNLLVLLVDFPDRPGDRNTGGPGAWHTRVFGSGPSGVAGYFRSVSDGRLAIRGRVTPWVRLSGSFSSYVSDGAGNLGGGVDPAAYPHNAQRLVEEAVAQLSDAWDWSEFDNNGDGLVDGLLVVTAGDGAEETAPLSDPQNRLRLLAHQFHTTFEVPLRGARGFDYAIVAADAVTGVVAHELGHLLGLIDLYHTGPFAGATGPFGVGDWSLMGTGALLDGGETPAGLDAWSALRLGSAREVAPPGAGGTVTLNPRTDAGPVLRIGRRGRPTEYFLAEARVRRGVDAALPGEGLVVYHVFEESQTNSSATRYKVAVVQADGRNDLGRPGGNRGDSGDPYPAATNDALDFGTTPSSAEYDGADSGVRLSGIVRGTDGVTLTARLEAPAEPRFTAVGLREITGDGDGRFEPGESVDLDLVIENAGGLGPDLETVLALESPAPDLQIAPALLNLGRLEAGGSRTLAGAFRLTAIPGGVIPEPFPLIARFTRPGCAGCPVVPDTLVLLPGAATLFSDDMEEGTLPWSHAAGTTGGRDPWRRATVDAHSGTHAWFCGSETSAPYDRGLDARLTSPLLAVPADARLVFWERVEAETLASDRAWDGGRIELATAGGAWEELIPVDGQEFTIETGSGNRLFGTGVSSGSRGWRRRVVDLTRHAGGTVRIRFRFATDLFDGPATSGPTGWWIDDVALEVTPPSSALTAALESDGSVRVRWTAPAGNDVTTYRLLRRPPDPNARPLRVADLPADPAGERTATDTPPPGNWIYRLDAVDAAGVVSRRETTAALRVPISGDRPSLTALHPSPFRPTGPRLTLEVTLPAVSGIRSGAIDIFDVQGRRVVSLPWTSADDTVYRVTWDGVTPRGTIRSGIYWLRLRWTVDGGAEEVGVTQRFVVVA